MKCLNKFTHLIREDVLFGHDVFSKPNKKTNENYRIIS